MIAGQELNALVADKVLGLTVASVTERTFHSPQAAETALWTEGADGSPEEIKDYSTDMAAAAEVLEWFKAGPWLFNLQNREDGMYVFSASIGEKTLVRVAETAPLAICLLAIEAVVGVNPSVFPTSEVSQYLRSQHGVESRSDQATESHPS